MSPAICQTLTMAISSPVSVCVNGKDAECEYRYTAEQIIKPGWKLVAGGYDTEAKEYSYFASFATPGGKSNTVLSAPFKKIMTKCSLRNTKLHYTESGLVQLLERLGIGRPSTFSSLIDKIQERGYVKLQDVRGKSLECREFVISEDIDALLDSGTKDLKKNIESKTEVREIGGESRKLVIQPLGIVVIEFLLEHFAPLFDYEFTKNMENQLDEIATGGMVWHELCYKCWFDVAAQLQELKERGVVKEEIHIDDHHSYILGRNGPVIRCRVSETIHSGDDAPDDADASDDDADTIGKKTKPKFVFKSVRQDLEYAKILRGEYSLAYMLGEDGNNASADGPAPIAVAGGGRLMGQHHGQDVVIKSGKYGAYVVWGSTNISLKPLLQGCGSGGGGGNVPSIPASGTGKCSKYTPKTKSTTNQKSEFDLTLEDLVQFIERNSAPGVVVEEKDGESSAAGSTSTAYVQGQILRTIDENTTIRYGRYGPYIFHKTAKMTKPAFVALKGFPEKHGNYITCDVAVIREWIATDAATPPKPKPKFGFFKKK